MSTGSRTIDPRQRSQDPAQRAKKQGRLRVADQRPKIEDPGSCGERAKKQGRLRTADQGQWMESKPWMKTFYKLNYRYVKVYEILWVAEMAQWERACLSSLCFKWVCCLLSPCPEGFSPGTPVSLIVEKPTFPNPNSNWLPLYHCWQAFTSTLHFFI